MKNTLSYNKVSNNEAGIIFVLLALTLPVLIFIISLVWAVQYTEGVRRENQTMVDSASLDAAIALDSTKWGYNMAIVKSLESVRAELASRVTSNNRDRIINELDQNIDTILEWMLTEAQVNGVHADDIYQGHLEYIKHNVSGLESVSFYAGSDNEFCFGRKGGNCELRVQVQRGRYWPQVVVDRWNNNAANRPVPENNFIYRNVAMRNDSDFRGQAQVASNVAALRNFEPFEQVSDDKIGEVFANSTWDNGDGFSLGTPNFVAANAVRVIVRRRLNLWMTLASFFKSNDNDFKVNEEALAVGGDIGDEDADDSIVRVAPFAIPACALIDPSGDYNPAYSCHLDRYFTQDDRFANAVNQDPIPGAFWGPLTESEYCETPLDNTPIDANRAAMCACAQNPRDGEEGIPCSDANGSKSVSCTFNAWQSHAKASNYYGVVGVPESSGIPQELNRRGLTPNERMIYFSIFSCLPIPRAAGEGNPAQEINNNWFASILGRLNGAGGVQGNDGDALGALFGRNISGGTVDARLGDRFFIADRWGQAPFDNNSIVGDALWQRISGQCRDCRNGTICFQNNINYETEYPFHNANRYSYGDADDVIDNGNGTFTGSAHKDLGFWYTLGRAHDKLGYPQVFGHQKSPLYSLYEAVGKGFVGNHVDANNRNVFIDYLTNTKMPRVEDWAIGPNACDDAPQYGTCGSRRVRYDTEDNEPTLYRHKYLTPAANPNFDPKIDPEAWTLYPGRTEGLASWNNIWGGVIPHLNAKQESWKEPGDRNDGNWLPSNINMNHSQEYVDAQANRRVFNGDSEDSEDSCKKSCKDYKGCKHGYVWNQKRYDNAYAAYEACKEYYKNVCGATEFPNQCQGLRCSTDACNCDDGQYTCSKGTCHVNNGTQNNGNGRSAEEKKLREAYCKLIFSDVCIEGRAGENRNKFLEEVCIADKKKEQEECVKAGAAESCADNNSYKEYYSDECEEDHEEKCGQCPPNNPDCHTADETQWCGACNSDAMSGCIAEKAAEILESGQCVIDMSECTAKDGDNPYNREGILPDYCEDGYDTYKDELEKQMEACKNAGDNMSCFDITQGQNSRCEGICNSCAEILTRGECCWSPEHDLMCGGVNSYWPSEKYDGWRTANTPNYAAYDPVYKDFGFCGQKIEVLGTGFKASVDALNSSSLTDAVYCEGDSDCSTDRQQNGAINNISEFSCPFMPQYMPYALLNNDQTNYPGEKYTPENTRVWRVAIPVIADVNQNQACNLISSDIPVRDHGAGANWIIVGFVETVIFDTDIGLGIQHAPGLSHSGTGKFPYTCDYEKGYAIKANAGSQMIDGELENIWVDLRHGREPWQFTPDFDANDEEDPVDDTGNPVACNMVRARISCESQLLASKDFGRNGIRKVRIVSK